MKTLSLLICILGIKVASSSILPTALLLEEWETWKLQHGKLYEGEDEEVARLKIWMETKTRVERHNQDFLKGKYTYYLGLNHLSDRLPAEKAVLNGYKREIKDTSKIEFYKRPKTTNFKAPEEFDWRDLGGVTEVKNQGYCGSCWAFSTTGALEGRTFVETGDLVSLSEQNLIDCDYNNDGCAGGDQGLAFNFIKVEGGIDTEDKYPYQDQDYNDNPYSYSCKYSSDDSAASDNGFVQISYGDEEAMKSALAEKGPLAISFDVEDDFFDAGGGIYRSDSCSEYGLNHAMLAVGYGEEDGSEFWIIKNSWGPDWGEDGYVRVARNENMCGVAVEPRYPKMDSDY